MERNKKNNISANVNSQQDRPIKPSKKGGYNLDFIDWNNEWERVGDIVNKLENNEQVSDEEEANRVRRHVQIELEKHGVLIDNFPMVVKVDITKECYICLKNFQRGRKVRKLPCNHMFCEDCLKPWIKTNYTCPTCKAKLREENEYDI